MKKEWGNLSDGVLLSAHLGTVEKGVTEREKERGTLVTEQCVSAAFDPSLTLSTL